MLASCRMLTRNHCWEATPEGYVTFNGDYGPFELYLLGDKIFRFETDTSWGICAFGQRPHDLACSEMTILTTLSAGN